MKEQEEMLSELKKARNGVIIHRIIWCLVCLGIPLIVSIYCSKPEDAKIFSLKDIDYIIFFAMFLFGAGIFIRFWSYFSKRKALVRYQRIYKQEMITKALNGAALYEKQELNFADGVSPEYVNNTGLFHIDIGRPFSRYSSDCHISGIYQGISFEQADVQYCAYHRSGRSGVSCDSFAGTLLAVPTYLPDATQTNFFNKNFDGNTVVARGGDSYEVSNKDFSRIFAVSTNAPEKAKSLLTDEFMNKVLKVQNRVHRNFCFAVQNGRMYIMLSHKNSALKAKLFSTYKDSMRDAVVKEVELAKMFIDEFSVKE